MAFGKKNVIKIDPLMYNIGLIGLGGIGKTTVIKEMCEKLAGEDGYLFLECGKEDGADAISNINYINCPDWNGEYDDLNNAAGFNVVISDIIENKDAEYPNLKVVVVDTFDQLREIVEPEVIRLHNKQHPDKPKITSIKQAFGGYMAGEDKADDMILDRLWELKTVGVHFIIIGHTKLREIVNETTGETYTQLTTDMSMRSFNKIKTKLHFLGVATIDREIVKEKKRGKDVGSIKGESRKIVFRDDNFAIDSKSRFADVVDEIPLDADALIKALTDAIESEAVKGGSTIAQLKKDQAKEAKEAAKVATENSAKARAKKIEAELEEKKDEFIETIQELFKDATTEQKTTAKSMLTDAGYSKFNEAPATLLQEIIETLS